MLIIDESTVKVGGVILPGLFKSFEIKGSARVEEVEVKGRSSKPKQATGYSDSKLNLELILLDDSTKTALEKLQVIQNLFKKTGQEKPIVHEIVSKHTSTRGITKVVFKDLTTKEKNDRSEMSVSIEFWEYIPITVTATKQSSSKTTGNKNPAQDAAAIKKLDQKYREYLEGRGRAPKIKSKTAKSPAVDNSKRGILYYGRRLILGGINRWLG